MSTRSVARPEAESPEDKEYREIDAMTLSDVWPLVAKARIMRTRSHQQRLQWRCVVLAAQAANYNEGQPMPRPRRRHPAVSA